MILAENKVIQPVDLPENIAGSTLDNDAHYDFDSISWEGAKHLFEKKYLHSLLSKTNGNILRAAAIAEITRENFYKKCTKLGIEWRSYRTAKEKTDY